MSDRYMNDMACGIEPEREGDEPTLEQWRDKCRWLWREHQFVRAKLDVAEEAIKEAASRAHNRLAVLSDMRPDYQLSSK